MRTGAGLESGRLPAEVGTSITEQRAHWYRLWRYLRAISSRLGYHARNFAS